MNIDSSPLIARARKIASDIYGDTKRKDGSRSVFDHAAGAAQIVLIFDLQDKEKSYCLSLLHDTLETAPSKRGVILEEFGEDFTKQLDLLTHEEMQSYDEYIDNIVTNALPDTVKVKLSDIFDSIMHKPSQKQVEKYMRVLPKLLERSLSMTV